MNENFYYKMETAKIQKVKAVDFCAKYFTHIDPQQDGSKCEIIFQYADQTKVVVEFIKEGFGLEIFKKEFKLQDIVHGITIQPAR